MNDNENFNKSIMTKINDMTANPNIYTDFLKFQGRVFKQPCNIALAFFMQNPQAEFIASEFQWKQAGYSLATQAEAIKFKDTNGNEVNYYDFSQMEKKNPPHIWSMNSGNAEKVKEKLGINGGIIGGIVRQTITTNGITRCMNNLNIPPQKYNDFAKSFINAVQVVIAGRLETGGNTFNMPVDMSAMKMFRTEKEKLTFMSYAAAAAKQALMKIERVMQEIEAEERNERNDLQRMAEINGRGTTESAGRGTSGSPGGNAGEQSDLLESNESERRTGVESNPETGERGENRVDTAVQVEDDRRPGILVQAESADGDVHSELQENRAVDNGTADRDIRNNVDGLHERELSGRRGMDVSDEPVPDNSTQGGQGSTGLQGTSGQSVREDNPTSDGKLQRDTSVGTGENVLLSQHSAEGESVSESERRLSNETSEKINNAFAENTETSTDSADVFNFSDNNSYELSDEERLVSITQEISETMKEYNENFSSFIQSGNFEEATRISNHLAELSKQAEELKKKIQSKEITEEDVKALRDIEPKRKSVQNMVETEVAQTPKFEKLLHEELGKNSPYEIRKGNTEWLEDESKTVQVIQVKKRDIPENLVELRKRNNIERGTFINNDTGMQIQFSRKAIEEIIAKAIPDDKRNTPVKARMSALYQMKEIIENAVCFDSEISEYNKETSKGKSPNTLFMHKMHGIMDYEGQNYLANISIEEFYSTDRENNFNGTNNRLYSFRDIEITPVKLLGGQAHANPQNVNQDTSSGVTTISIPQLYQFVKTFDKSFFENSEAIGRTERLEEIHQQEEYKQHTAEVEKLIEQSEYNELMHTGLKAGLSQEQLAMLENAVHQMAEKGLKIDVPVGNGLSFGIADMLNQAVDESEHDFKVMTSSMAEWAANPTEENYNQMLETRAGVAIETEVIYLFDDIRRCGDRYRGLDLSGILYSKFEKFYGDKEKIINEFSKVISEENAERAYQLIDRNYKSLAFRKKICPFDYDMFFRKFVFAEQREDFYKIHNLNGELENISDLLNIPITIENGENIIKISTDNLTEDLVKKLEEKLNTEYSVRHIEDELDELAKQEQAVTQQVSSEPIQTNEKISAEDVQVGDVIIEQEQKQEQNTDKPEQVQDESEKESISESLTSLNEQSEQQNAEKSSLPFKVGDEVPYNAGLSSENADTYMWTVENIDEENNYITLTHETGNIVIPEESETIFLDEYIKYFNSHNVGNTEKNITAEEPDISENNIYRIYQIKSGEKYHGIRYESFEANQNANLTIDDYDLVYEGNWDELPGVSAEDKLNSLWENLNREMPENFNGHSLSMSDVVVVGGDTQKAYYVDRLGFADMPEFFIEKENTLFNALEDLGQIDKIYINPEKENIQIVHFNPDSDEGGQLVYSEVPFDVVRESIEYDDPFSYMEGVGRQTTIDITHDDFNYYVEEFLQDNENFRRSWNEKKGTILNDLIKIVNDYAEIEKTSEYVDKTPELREVLNEFSERHNLGELNVINAGDSIELSETFKDRTTHTITTLELSDNSEFTSEALKTALEEFEEQIEKRQMDISNLHSRKEIMQYHGGKSELPDPPVPLPEISYAENPTFKIYNNLEAISEMIRLENAQQNGEELYDKRSNQYNSKQNSDKRLRQYCGWGGLPQIFDEDNANFVYQRKNLKNMLTKEEYDNARASTLNAHYTPQIIIDAMYKAIKNMGLQRDSRVLEPACGTGNFIARLPHSLGNTEVVGVELDNVTAKIAKWLNSENPNVKIISSGFENTDFENNSFDLAIGNVPFGNYNLNDPDYVSDWKIHDAFFRKALDKVAPGGVVAFITSSGTMDKKNPKIREYLAERAELIGAIRLPNNAFSEAGTKVTSDIIFLQKRENPLQPDDQKPDWCYTIPDENGFMINSYFVENPHMLLGKMEQTTHYNMLTCTPFEGKSLEKQLDEAIKNLNAEITVRREKKESEQRKNMLEPWGKNFTYQVKNDKIYYRSGSEMKEITENAEVISKLCELRSTARQLLEMQETAADEELVPIREKLNNLYDNFIFEHGSLTSKEIRDIFGADSDYPILQSLENFDKQEQKYKKADIFFFRTVNVNAEVKSAENIQQALQISLDRKGRIDLTYMANLLAESYSGLSADEAIKNIYSELIENEYIFKDPEKVIAGEEYSGIVERSEYLSGNVRRKLAFAEEYAENDPAYKANVDALEKVIPEDIKADEIAVQMGCSWIDQEDYTQFLDYLSERKGFNSKGHEVHYSPVTGEFEITLARSKKNLNTNETTTYGTPDYNMYQLAEKILNQRRIVVKKEFPDPQDPSKTVTRTDPKATKVAIDKANLIKQKFKEWIFADEYRREKYERRYNNLFNSLVGREYDGSNLTFSGMNNKFVLRPHQKNCIARAIYGGNTLAAHVVGAGKSAVIFSTVMKKKELGLINKACVVVPKALTEQTANEWRNLFPNAKLLTVTSDDLSSEIKRKIFAAKVATGSYDAVIVSNEQFEKLAMSKKYRAEFIQQEIDSLDDMLSGLKTAGKGKKDYTIKSIESAKKRLQTRLDKITNPKSAVKEKDDLLDFEQLGFDYLVCDEAHIYKNGFVSTKMTNVSGVTTKPSGRAEDMQMKTDYFNKTFGNGHILFCTGTPVSNSMTELYVMTRYLRPDLLEQAGVARFDDWAATFGIVVAKYKQSADGTLKLKTCFAKFANLPELMAMYKEFADIQSADKLNLPRPELKTGKPQIIKAEASPEQRMYVKNLAARSQAISNGEVTSDKDNMLKITGEARLIGLGDFMVKSFYEKSDELPDDFQVSKDSKTDLCIEKVAEIYNATESEKGVQIIFSDIAVNSDNGNFSVYNYIKKELTEHGIPEDKIMFAPKSDSTERENIFRKINEGEYRVVIASTGTLGTGANVQQSLYAVHHLDIPWKPSDIEQREGRILRQGNKFNEVEIFNYITEGTLDSYLYQILTDKARFIAQLLDDKCPARVSEDCDEKVLTFGEIQAAAEGNPDFKKRIELSNEIAELTLLKNEYAHETAKTRQKTEEIPLQTEKFRNILKRVKSDKEKSGNIAELIAKTSSGNIITDKKEINSYLINMAKRTGKTTETISVNGFKVSTICEWDDEVKFNVRGQSEYSCSAGITEHQDNYQRILNVFKITIPKHEQEVAAEIQTLEENLVQANQRLQMPFAHEEELQQKIQEFNKLEEKLAGISECSDEIFDPEDTDIIETQEEKAKREELYDTDNDDFQPHEDDSITPPTPPNLSKM